MTEETVQRELGHISATLSQIQTALKALEGLPGDVKALQADMAEVKPITERITRWQAVGTGVVLAVGAFGAFVGITLATAKQWLLGVLWGQ